MDNFKRKLLRVAGRRFGIVAICLQVLPTGQTVQHNADREYRAASMIKLLVMAEVFRRFEDGTLDPDETVVVRKADRVGGDGVIKTFDDGHTLSLRELVILMIIVSDNTAANLLINRVGMESVNRLAADLGMEGTSLQRLMMDLTAVSEGRENYTTALDLLIFFQKLYDRELDGSEAMLDILKKQQVRGRLEKYLPEGTDIAWKTGDLGRLEHAGSIFFTANADYILVVLTDQLPNSDGQELIARISETAFREIVR